MVEDIVSFGGLTAILHVFHSGSADEIKAVFRKFVTELEAAGHLVNHGTLTFTNEMHNLVPGTAFTASESPVDSSPAV
jgi:hypothetical protein